MDAFSGYSNPAVAPVRVSPVQAAATARNATNKCSQHIARYADSKPAVNATTITSISITNTAVAAGQRGHN